MGRRSRDSGSQRARVERLEPRQLLSISISGRIFDDLNANGKVNRKEPYLAGIQVFLDENGTGHRSANDPIAVTDKHGNFRLKKLPRGTYRLYVDLPPGLMTSLPAGGEWTFVNLRHSISRNFGLTKAPAVQHQPGDTDPPTAVLSSAPPVTTSAGTYDFSVTYSDASGVAVSSLENGNVIVTGPGNFLTSGVLLSTDGSTDGSPRTATYEITPPNGAWTPANNGTYTIALQAGEVRDVLGNVAAAQTLGSFTVAIGSPIVAPLAPAAPILLPASDTGASSSDDLTELNNASTETALQFQVNGVVAGATVTLYADGSAIGSTVANGDSALITTDGHTLLADGVHSITTRQLSADGLMSVDSSALNVRIDTVAPTAQLAASDVTASGGQSYNFAVIYGDDVAIDAASLGDGNIVVSGPHGFQAAALLVPTGTDASGSTQQASYTIVPPGGSWDAADDGQYTIAIAPNSVRDAAGNTIAGGILGTFNVNVTTPGSAPPGEPMLAAVSDTGASSSDGLTRLNNATPASALQFIIPGTIAEATVQLYADGHLIAAATATGSTTTLTTNGSTVLADGAHTFAATQTEPGLPESAASLGRAITIDTVAPIASASSLADVGSAGGTVYSFGVTYADGIALNSASLDGSDVVITGPGNFSESAALVAVSAAPGNTQCTASYSITPPGGKWTAQSSGTYTLTLHSAQIFDAAGNAAPQAVLGQFKVVIAAAGSAIPAAPVLLASSDTGSSSSDGLTDRNNASPGTTLQFSVANTTPGAAVTVYCDGAPVGQAIASGSTTTITTDGRTPLRDGAHQFTVRQQASGGATQSGDSPATAVTIDATPPTGSATAMDVTAEGLTTSFFRVTWSCGCAPSLASLHDGNVLVTGPNGYTQAATFVTVDSSSAGSVTAVYQIRPPGDEWVAMDNGTYTIRAQGNQVCDAAGNYAAAGAAVGTFHVNVPAPAPARVTLLAGCINSYSSTGPVTSLTNSSFDTKLQFTVSGVVPGAIITLYADGRTIGSATASMDPMPIATDGVTALGYGPHTITARLTLPNAPQSADSAPLVIVVSP